MGNRDSGVDSAMADGRAASGGLHGRAARPRCAMPLRKWLVHPPRELSKRPRRTIPGDPQRTHVLRTGHSAVERWLVRIRLETFLRRHGPLRFGADVIGQPASCRDGAALIAALHGAQAFLFLLLASPVADVIEDPFLGQLHPGVPD